jgi:hypothetical protein
MTPRQLHELHKRLAFVEDWRFILSGLLLSALMIGKASGALS